MSHSEDTFAYPTIDNHGFANGDALLRRVDAPHDAHPQSPKLVIFDTDMGNDIDDALALAALHALAQQGECRLLGVAVSKDNPYAAQYVDVVNTYYGFGDIPIGKVVDGVMPEDGKFVRQVVNAETDGEIRYRKTFADDSYELAVPMLRRLLVEQRDHSVILVMVGFSTNMAQLLDSPGDALSPLNGKELFKQKVSQVVAMAANFSPEVQANPTMENREYNVHRDVPAARKFFHECPVPVLFCGFEIGCELMFPARSFETDYQWCDYHPVVEAYYNYKDMPYDRPSWDQATVLAAVRPEYNYFEESEAGTVTIDEQGIAIFKADKHGLHKYLILSPENQRRVLKDIITLCAQPVATQDRATVNSAN
jgi:inosine-uridine nucleoside N-ribohydrolase